MYTKNIIIIIFFISILVPFIMINNTYPFFRYGMFAEPVHHTNHFEHFVILYTDELNEEYSFSSTSIGLNEGHFNYIIRSYYYQGKIQQLFSQLHQILEKKQKISAWKLKKLHISPDKAPTTMDQITWKVYE